MICTKLWLIESLESKLGKCKFIYLLKASVSGSLVSGIGQGCHLSPVSVVVFFSFPVCHFSHSVTSEDAGITVNSLWPSDGIWHQRPSLKRKCLHFDEIFITGCTGSCQNDNFQCSQWLKFRQNDDIFVSVMVSFGSGNGLVPSCTKLLPEPTLINYHLRYYSSLLRAVP